MKAKYLGRILLVSVLLAGCGKTSTPPGEMIVEKVEVGDVVQNISMNISKVPDTLDPQFNTEGEGTFVMNHIYEGLMRQVGDQLMNGVAKAYTVSEDGLTYTFTLRDAGWSDGVELTADDFVYAWKRGADPILGGSHLADYEKAGIKNAGAIARGEMSTASLGVLALDNHTLEVTLEAPNEAFLDYLTLESFMPLREDILSANNKWTKENAVYNGPFKIATMTSEGITLVKNEIYPQAEGVNLQNINLKVMGDEETARTAYLKEDLDILVGPMKMVDTSNIVLTPPVLDESEAGQEIATQGDHKDGTESAEQKAEESNGAENKEAANKADTMQNNESGEETNAEAENDTKEETNEADSTENAEEALGNLIVHSWLSGWRINLQNQIWLGNAYVEEHEA